mmetsp:Transcript_6366/g.8382  ORF Transcript_6366/g.8382 Transcript_6366/m.8382 type:complete len:95 (-) Transcript_6366:201-485(-)
MHSRNRVSYSNEQTLFWVKSSRNRIVLAKMPSEGSSIMCVHYEARLKAGELYDQFQKKKGYPIPPIDRFRRWLGWVEEKEASQARFLQIKKVRR